MVKLKLTGRLGKAFGKEVSLEVSTIPEAIRALCLQIDGFESTLKEGAYKVTRSGPNGTFEVGPEDLNLLLGHTHTVTIKPVARGNKRGGLGKILLGVLLIGAAFFFAPIAGLSATIGGTSMTYGYLANIGAMMVLNGVAQMLAPQPKSENAEEDASHILDATGNRLEQGGGVPLIYGEVYTGSVVVSTGMTVEEFPINPDGADGKGSVFDPIFDGFNGLIPATPVEPDPEEPPTLPGKWPFFNPAN